MANLMTELVKLILLPILKAKFGYIKETPETEKMRQSLLEHQNRHEKLLKTICERDPDNWRCKEYFEKYPERRPKQ